MSIRRFTRLTNGFSKGFTQLQWAAASCNFDAPKRSESAAETSSCKESRTHFPIKSRHPRILRSVALSHFLPVNEQRRNCHHRDRLPLPRWRERHRIILETARGRPRGGF